MSYIKNKSDRGVSPVIGVVIMVALVVVLGAIIGVFVLDLSGDTDKPAQAGVTFDTSEEGVVLQWNSNQTAENIIVNVDGSEYGTLNSVGDTVTISYSDITAGSDVTLIGVTDTGNRTVLINSALSDEVGNLDDYTQVFDVTINSIDSSVSQGGTSTVNYTVTNVSDKETTETIVYSIEDMEADTKEVTLAPDESYTGTMEWNTESTQQKGYYIAGVSAARNTQYKIITVGDIKENASFQTQFTGDSKDRTEPIQVNQGESFDVSYLVQNVGDFSDTQNIDITMDTISLTDENIQLTNSETYENTVSVNVPSSFSDGVYTLQVSSADDSVEQDIIVGNPSQPIYSVNVTNAVINQDDSVTVNYKIKNMGGSDGTKTITGDLADINSNSYSGSRTIEENLTLAPNETHTATYTFNKSADGASKVNPKTHKFRVKSEKTEETVYVDDNISLEEVIVRTNENTSFIEYTLQNTGGITQEQTVESYIYDTSTNQRIASKMITLQNSETYSDTFIYDEFEGSYINNNYILVVKSNNSYDSEELGISTTVGPLDPKITNTPDQVDQGNSIDVEYLINNDNNIQQSSDVEVIIKSHATADGSIYKTSTTVGSLTVDGNTSKSQTTNISIPSGFSDGYYNVIVKSDSRTSNQFIEVGSFDEPYFKIDITDVSPQYETKQGSKVVVDYTMTNVGDITGESYIHTDVKYTDGLEYYSDPVELEGGESVSDSFVWNVDSDQRPQYYDISIGSIDETKKEIIRVTEVSTESNYEVSIDNVDKFKHSSSSQVTYTVTNTGSGAGEQNVVLTLDGRDRYTQSNVIGLDAGESTTVTTTFSVEKDHISTGTYNLTIESYDTSDTATVEVIESSTSDVSITVDSVTDPVYQSDTLEASYTITNNGSSSITETVSLQLGNNNIINQKEVTVSANSSVSGTISGTISSIATTGDKLVYINIGTKSDSMTTTVKQTQANMDISVNSYDNKVISGDTVSLNVTITNNGTESATPSVELLLGDQSLSTSYNVGNISPDESTTITVNGTIPSETTAGNYNLTIKTNDSSSTNTIEIVNEPTFEITNVTTNTPVSNDETVSVTYTVKNTGSVESTKDITTTISSSETYNNNKTITLTSGSSQTTTISIPSEETSTGQQTITVSTMNDSVSKTVEIQSSTVDYTNIPDCSTHTYEGGGTTDNPYKVSNVYDLQCINQDTTAHYELTQDIDASYTSEWSKSEFTSTGYAFTSRDYTVKYPIDSVQSIVDANGNSIGYTVTDANNGKIDINVSEAKEVTVKYTSQNSINTGFIPINSLGSQTYGGDNGFIYGNNYTVNGLYIDGDIQNKQQIGLISTIHYGSSVNNIGLTNVDIIGGFRSSGGIAGINDGNISGSYITGSITTSQTSAVGGLVGRNRGTISNGSYSSITISEQNNPSEVKIGGLAGINEGTITKSYAKNVNVSGSYRVGGLVGFNVDTNSGSINKSYVIDSSISSENYAGGIAGDQRSGSTITNVYTNSNTSVTSNYYAGGLVGYTDNDDGSLTNSYSAASVSGDRTGGIVGYHTTGTTTMIDNVYWDKNTSGQSDPAYSKLYNGYQSGLTTSEMQGSSASSNMSALDFNSIWTTVDGGYPNLQWENN